MVLELPVGTGLSNVHVPVSNVGFSKLLPESETESFPEVNAQTILSDPAFAVVIAGVFTISTSSEELGQAPGPVITQLNLYVCPGCKPVMVVFRNDGFVIVTVDPDT